MCGGLQQLSTILTTVTFPVPLSSIGPGFSYGIYVACDLVAFALVRLLVEATKNRTLVDMPQYAETRS